MWRAATPAQLNLLQAVVDFTLMVKNPNWMQDMVEAAAKITAQNKLTDEEIAKLNAAGKTIAEADAKLKELSQTHEALRQAADQQHATAHAHTQRDNDLDLLKKQLVTQETAVTQRESEAARREQEISKREKDHGVNVANFEKRQQLADAAATRRENAIAEKEARHAKAQALLAG